MDKKSDRYDHLWGTGPRPEVGGNDRRQKPKTECALRTGIVTLLKVMMKEREPSKVGYAHQHVQIGDGHLTT